MASLTVVLSLLLLDHAGFCSSSTFIAPVYHPALPMPLLSRPHCMAIHTAVCFLGSLSWNGFLLRGQEQTSEKCQTNPTGLIYFPAGVLNPMSFLLSVFYYPGKENWLSSFSLTQYFAHQLIFVEFLLIEGKVSFFG